MLMKIELVLLLILGKNKIGKVFGLKYIILVFLMVMVGVGYLII